MGPSRYAIVVARSAEEIEAARLLFREYRAELGVDLGFQGFDEEVASLPGEYRPPGGELWLAVGDEGAVGCGGLRPFSPEVAEMKRLYVRPAARGAGVGRRLAQAIVTTARAADYRAIVLDTLATMAEAQALYRSLGFREIPPYRFNPLAGARYYRLDLDRAPRPVASPRGTDK